MNVREKVSEGGLENVSKDGLCSPDLINAYPNII